MELEIDRWIGAAAVVKQVLYRSVLAKLSIYWSVYVPTLTYGHELWCDQKKQSREYKRSK